MRSPEAVSTVLMTEESSATKVPGQTPRTPPAERNRASVYFPSASGRSGSMTENDEPRKPTGTGPSIGTPRSRHVFETVSKTLVRFHTASS